MKKTKILLNKLWNKLKKIPLYIGMLALPFLANKLEAQVPSLTPENAPVVTINPVWHPYYYKNPSEWNHADSVWNLADEDTKIQMLEYAFKQDSVYNYGGMTIWDNGDTIIWNDADFALQTMINYNGYDELVDGSLNMANFGGFLEHNGEFKIPVYFATIYETNKTYNTVLVGENIFDLKDWYVFDSNMPPETPDRRLIPGHGLPSNSSYFNWNTISYWENYMVSADTVIHYRSPPNILSLSYTSDTTGVNSYDEYALVKTNPKLDSIPPQITCSIQDSSVANILSFDISVSDCASDSSFLNEYQFYKIDSQELDTFPGTYNSIYFEQGEYCKLPLYKKDITIPIDSLQDGAHTLKIYGLDLPMNKDSLIINFTQDATPPELVVNSPENTTYHVNKIPLDFIASDANLNSASSYFQLNSQNKIYLNQQIPDSIIAEQGQNQLKFNIYDLAGNSTPKTRNFYSDTTNSILENKISEFKLYPNPTNSNFTIEYSSQKPEDISYKLYNSQGQELEKKLIKSKAGKNKFNVSLGNYSKGIYFLNFISSNYSKAEIIIKK